MLEILDSPEVYMNRKINQEHLLTLIKEIKRKQNKDNEEDTLLAYVAMGGQEDKEGFVDANKLIKIIRDDFEMTIDIEQLIKDIDDDGSGKIEYGEFNSLLNS